MPGPIFDSHAHYDSNQFRADREELLGKVLPAAGVVGVINMGSDFPGCLDTLKLVEEYDYIYGAAGIHPECAKDLPEDWLSQIEKMVQRPKMVAVGEIGLDYHWLDACPKDRQQEVFEAQLALANRLEMPVSVHDREAHGDTMALLRQYKPKGVMHCFSGSVEMARELLDLGLYIGLGGVVTFKNSRHAVEVAAQIPLDRLLLETDAPYMAPVPHRGTRCDSSLIPFSAAKVAEIKDLTVEEVLAVTCENGKKFYAIGV